MVNNVSSYYVQPLGLDAFCTFWLAELLIMGYFSSTSYIINLKDISYVATTCSEYQIK
nr:MAG TPA: hypothetical protein [Microviridae sp.]